LPLVFAFRIMLLYFVTTFRYNNLLSSEARQTSKYLDRFLYHDEVTDSIRLILYVAGVITLSHLVLLWSIKKRQSSKKMEGGSTEGKRRASYASWKDSYQLTNLIVNLFLGCLGAYFQVMRIPWDTSTTEQIVGYEGMKFFAIGQIGYQLWALPIGTFFIHEPTEMLIHHAAVVCVAQFGAFYHCGFRYFHPFFFGVVELSSVPLSIMNSFKNNDYLIGTYPLMYRAVRWVFGVTFLLVRVAFWTPLYWKFFTIGSMLLYESDLGFIGKMLFTGFFFAGIVLTVLQYYWAWKIIMGLAKGLNQVRRI